MSVCIHAGMIPSYDDPSCRALGSFEPNYPKAAAEPCPANSACKPVQTHAVSNRIMCGWSFAHSIGAYASKVEAVPEHGPEAIDETSSACKRQSAATRFAI